MTQDKEECCRMVRYAKKLKKWLNVDTNDEKRDCVHILIKFMKRDMEMDFGGIRERAPYSEDSIKKILYDEGIGRYQVGNTRALCDYFLRGDFLNDTWWHNEFSVEEKNEILNSNP